MGSSEEYLLRWDDFEANIASAFRGLRGDDEFSDIRLICPDVALSGGQAVENLTHQTLKAHKVILSTCSPYFRGLLRHLKGSETPFQVPFIVMRGVNIHHMASILDFMYYGEVNINQAELDTFLALAEELQVKGLTQKKGGQKDPSSGNAHAPPPKRRKTAPPPAAQMPAPPKNDNGAIKEELNDSHDAEPEVEEVDDMKEEEQYYEYEGQADYSVAGGEDPGEGTSNYGNDRKGGGTHVHNQGYETTDVIEKVAMSDNEYMSRINKLFRQNPETYLYQCTGCTQSFVTRGSIQNHIESVHLKLRQYPCKFCGKAFFNKNARTTHMRRHHRDEAMVAQVLF